MLGAPAAEAIDAFLVTGGLPLILDEWPQGASLWDYLESAVRRPTSALIVSGERALAAEFPAEAQARTVLGAIVADPHLRFWLSFISAGMPAIERGRGDQVLAAIRQKWTSWRGRAIEPLVRQSLLRLPPGTLPSGTDAVGGYWTRTNDPEIDLVGADRAPIAKKVTMTGSIKWLENKPFDGRDLARLVIHRSRLPGADDTTPLLAVSRTGTTTSGVTILTPDDLLTAWERS
jgi:hypothetical protein